LEINNRLVGPKGLDRVASQLVSLPRKLANLFRSEIFRISPLGWCIAFEPYRQGGTGGQRFPTSPKTARTLGPGWVDNMVTNLGMSHIRAAVKLPIQDDSTTDARADRHVDQSRLAFSSAPTCLPEGRSIGVVFQGHGHVERPRQIFHWVVPSPSREKINVAKCTADWVHHTGGTNADARNFAAGIPRRFSQHADHPLQPVCVATMGVGRRLQLGQDLPGFIYNADRYLRSTDINSANHDFPFWISTPLFNRPQVRGTTSDPPSFPLRRVTGHIRF
jgi:hypothetical protein